VENDDSIWWHCGYQPNSQPTSKRKNHFNGSRVKYPEDSVSVLA